jgi:hypothetical protein
MKLKKLFFLLILIFSKTVLAKGRLCKPSILRSFKYEGRIAPNRVCSVCPKIDYNCCTNLDQMSIHKNWKSHTKSRLLNIYKDNIKAFDSLKQMLAAKMDIDFQEMTKIFREVSKPKPSDDVIRHLEKLQKEYDEIPVLDLEKIHKVCVKKVFPRIYKMMLKLRKGFLCGLCDWHFHQDVNLDSMTIMYKNGFCMKLVDGFLDIAVEKNKFYRMMLLFDEFLYLTTSQKLLEEDDRNTYRRYGMIISKCVENRTKLVNCEEFCKEFNVNRLTYLFDGEEKSLKDFMKKFLKFDNEFSGNKKLFFSNNKSKILHYKKKEVDDYSENHSLFSTKKVENKKIKTLKKNSFGLEFKSYPHVNYFEKKHRVNEIQLERVENELSSFTLFRLNDDPIDLTNLTIFFDKYEGIDLFEQASKTNLDITTHNLLALIHSGGTEAAAANEYIEKDVEDILKPIQVKFLSNWLTDSKIKFKKFKLESQFKENAEKWFMRPAMSRITDFFTGKQFVDKKTGQEKVILH